MYQWLRSDYLQSVTGIPIEVPDSSSKSQAGQHDVSQRVLAIGNIAGMKILKYRSRIDAR